jgi:hypothetical protein
MAAELSLTCQVCGRRFTAALQIDRETFERIRIPDQFECCRFCTQARRYSRDDYYFAEED